jgi:hypothetical protein
VGRLVGEERNGDDGRRGFRKTLHSVMAMWTDDDNAKNKGVEKGNDNESEN